jgi:UTP--glucose-1-phosphate uridylyltransferase
MANSSNNNLNPALIEKMKSMGIDIPLTQRILDNFNAGKYDHFEPVAVKDIPKVDGDRIIDVTGDVSFSTTAAQAQKAIDALGVQVDIASLGEVRGDTISFDAAALERLGVLLYDVVAYGVLNGGSASSYVDRTKNVGFNQTLFQIC